MTTDALLKPFMNVTIFHGLAEDRLTQIARAAERIIFQPGEVIQSEGDIPDAAILIVSGDVLIVDEPTDETGDPVVSGSLIGELAMLIETRAISTVVTRSAVRAFRIPRRRLRSLMETDPEIAEHFVARITHRLNEMAAEMRRVDVALAATVERIPPPLPGKASPSAIAHHVH